MVFEVDTGRVAEAVTSLQSELDAIKKEKTAMYTALEALDGMWEGAAHDDFAAQYAADNEKLTALCTTVQSIIENISAARSAYDTCEQSVKGEISKVQV